MVGKPSQAEQRLRQGEKLRLFFSYSVIGFPSLDLQRFFISRLSAFFCQTRRSSWESSGLCIGRSQSSVGPLYTTLVVLCSIGMYFFFFLFWLRVTVVVVDCSSPHPSFHRVA
ncbi:hypothetical protein F4802DRAFT_31005 [Xylaria palmicola]|nr:hypothetical protein F4802DRAFT_31005 [Xylaria palmicola]